MENDASLQCLCQWGGGKKIYTVAWTRKLWILQMSVQKVFMEDMGSPWETWLLFLCSVFHQQYMWVSLFCFRMGLRRHDLSPCRHWWFDFKVRIMLVDVPWWSVETKYWRSRTNEEKLIAIMGKESSCPARLWLEGMRVGPCEIRQHTMPLLSSSRSPSPKNLLGFHYHFSNSVWLPLGAYL